MSVLSYFTGIDQISAAAESVSGALSERNSSGTLWRFGAGDLDNLYRGQGLAYGSMGADTGWTDGTLTGFEVQYKGQTQWRIEGFAFPAANLNTSGLFELALAGNDTVNGSPLSDDLSSGPGNDIVTGGAGNDWMFENEGNDRYDGGPGLDVIDQGDYPRENIELIPQADGSVRILDKPFNQVDIAVNVEYMFFGDQRVDLLNLALGAPVAPDAIGTQVYRFAKVDSGQYFYTGNLAERNQIVASLPNFRYEGPVFNAQDNWVTDFNPVYRFANLGNGGYFYTATVAERDSVLASYPDYRYEGASFYVPSAASADTVPVFRLANVRTGGYLFTTSAAERQFAQSLGFFRDEGVAFNAPKAIALAFSAEGDAFALAGDDLPLSAQASELPGAAPRSEVASMPIDGWLI